MVPALRMGNLGDRLTGELGIKTATLSGVIPTPSQCDIKLHELF
jgi:hypothetical protein